MIAVVAWGLVPTSALSAQGPSPVPGRTWSLAELLDSADVRSPAARAARLRVDSAAAEVRIARAWANPVLQANPNTPYQYITSAPLDVGPQRTWRTRTAAQGVTATRFDDADARRQLRLGVRSAWFDLLLARESAQLARDTRDALAAVARGDSARLRAGDIAERVLVRSALDLARAEAEIVAADGAVRQARVALADAAGLSRPDTVFDVAGSMAYRPLEAADQETLLDGAWRDRPDARAAEQRVTQAEAARRYAASLQMPVPQVSAVYQPTGPFELDQVWTFGRTSLWSLGLGVELPLWNRYAGSRDRAAAGQRLAEETARATLYQVRADVVAALAQVRASEALVRRYDGGLLAAARQALETAQVAWRAGATSYVEYLDAVRTWADTRGDYARALHDYWVGVSQLDAAVGRDLLVP